MGTKKSEILIAYSTTDGHTLEICGYLKHCIEQQGHRVTLLSVETGINENIDLKPFDKIVLGASIRYGKHAKEVYEFIRRNERILESKPNAFFSVNVVARKPEKNTPETNPYLKNISQTDYLATNGTGSICRQDRLSKISFPGPADDTSDYVDD